MRLRQRTSPGCLAFCSHPPAFSPGGSGRTAHLRRSATDCSGPTSSRTALSTSAGRRDGREARSGRTTLRPRRPAAPRSGAARARRPGTSRRERPRGRRRRNVRPLTLNAQRSSAEPFLLGVGCSHGALNVLPRALGVISSARALVVHFPRQHRAAVVPTFPARPGIPFRSQAAPGMAKNVDVRARRPTSDASRGATG